MQLMPVHLMEILHVPSSSTDLDSAVIIIIIIISCLTNSIRISSIPHGHEQVSDVCNNVAW